MSKIQIQLSDGRNINLDLYEDVAPITVKNFKKLIKENFFDGLCFHRTIKDFMIQGGGFVADGRAIKEKGGADTIKGEFLSNGGEKRPAPRRRRDFDGAHQRQRQRVQSVFHLLCRLRVSGRTICGLWENFGRGKSCGREKHFKSPDSQFHVL